MGLTKTILKTISRIFNPRSRLTSPMRKALYHATLKKIPDLITSPLERDAIFGIPNIERFSRRYGIDPMQWFKFKENSKALLALGKKEKPGFGLLTEAELPKARKYRIFARYQMTDPLTNEKTYIVRSWYTNSIGTMQNLQRRARRNFSRWSYEGLPEAEAVQIEGILHNKGFEY